MALNFSYHSHTQQSIVNLLIPAVNKITYSLKWALDECCWSYFHKCYITLNITIFGNSFSAERDISDLIVPNIICFQTQKQLATLNNIQVLLKSVLINLHAHNFMQVKISLHACCMPTCHCACNLASPEDGFFLCLSKKITKVYYVVSSSVWNTVISSLGKLRLSEIKLA